VDTPADTVAVTGAAHHDLASHFLGDVGRVGAARSLELVAEVTEGVDPDPKVAMARATLTDALE
jgi:hypothetical protein